MAMERAAPAMLQLFILVLLGVQSATTQNSRQERAALLPPPLVYPFGGTLKLLMGHAIPISMPGRILSYSQNLQFQFPLPQNASSFTGYLGARRASRRRRQSDLVLERPLAYQFLQQQVHRRGGPGKECVKRSICEAAETPLGDQGLVGEILHVLLTPDYGDSRLGVDEDYLEAAETGRRGDDCRQAYDCPEGFGLLDHISQLLDRD